MVRVRSFVKSFNRQLQVALSNVDSGEVVVCRWCSIGHMFMANLAVYKDLGELGPIDELDMPALQELSDPETVAELERRLVGRWSHLAPIARRLFELRTGEAAPEDEGDDLLLRTDLMWEWVIECTIMAFDFPPETIPAWSPEGKDSALVERYREARRLAKRALEDGEPS